MGDFNSQPFSVPIAILRSHAGLTDSFHETHPSANEFANSRLSPQDAISRFGMTCDSPLCSYSAGKPIPDNVTEQGGKRLDYIFYRQPEIARRRPLIWGYRDTVGNGWAGEEGLEEGKPMLQSVSSAPILRCVDSKVVLTELVPGKRFSYSDHFALVSTFHIDAPEKRREDGNSDAKNFTPLVPLLNDAESVNANTTTFAPISPSQSRSADRRSTASNGEKSTIVRAALNTLRLYTRISQRTAKLHMRIFAAAVMGLIILTVGSAWQPKSWLQPIFTLVGGLLGAAGATFLYTGFVWGRWELGLLTETTEEMELELRVVEMEENARP
jgi:sphingomyelin phosphodiesterase 2